MNQSQSQNQSIAAIDMGSNSFHMVIARVDQDEIRVLGKLTEKIQLGAALNKRGCLSVAAQKKALACLARFAQRLGDLPAGRLRIVGTNALRVAKNTNEFIARAEKLLGHPIEIISGREEARLIYLGVAHTLADDVGRRLVIDIGGGSTEIIIGERFESQVLESLHMGCVSYTQKFFSQGQLSAKYFQQAVLAARQEVVSIEAQYKKIGWHNAVGASGTINAIAEIVQQNGWSSNGITEQSLQQLVHCILQHKNASTLKIKGLKEERKFILPAGVAILVALFQQLEIKKLHYSEGALREGVLYDILGRDQHEDVRDRTTQAFVKRYQIEMEQAERVSHTALMLFNAVKEAWSIDKSVFHDLLARSAYLHEVGLAISHTAFHKHGAYLIRYSDLPGFSRQEQQVMAALIRCHRRKFDMQVFKELPTGWYRPAVLLTLILRLAVLFHHARVAIILPCFQWTVSGAEMILKLESAWLANNPLVVADLEQEKNYLAMVGVNLLITT